MGYKWVSSFFPMMSKLNIRWDLISTKSHWRSRFCNAWSFYLEPKHAFFAWSLMHQGFLVSSWLCYMGVPEPRCAFFGSSESCLHLY